jgi:uncharacterized protein (DUF1778 family)
MVNDLEISWKRKARAGGGPPRDRRFQLRATASQRHFTLDDKQWKLFTQALKRPPVAKPRLRRLFSEPHVANR